MYIINPIAYTNMYRLAVWGLWVVLSQAWFGMMGKGLGCEGLRLDSGGIPSHTPFVCVGGCQFQQNSIRVKTDLCCIDEPRSLVLPGAL